MSSREVFGLVIVKELFDPERSACSPLVFNVFEESGIPCLLLDYLEFQQLTFFRRTGGEFRGHALGNLLSRSRARCVSTHPLWPGCGWADGVLAAQIDRPARLDYQ